MEEGETLTQEGLRDLYWNALRKEKQCHIAKQTGIHAAILSQFKNGKIDLYPYLFEKLEAYLTNNNSQ